jgi:uncharacterized protein
VIGTSLLRSPFHLVRESPFSYECKACKRCCTGKRIPVNPYEVARLARHVGLSTTAFLEKHTEVGGAILRRSDDQRCVFLGEGGCSVHSSRPVACRLYPLGRQRASGGEERFAELQPHPQSEGVYGNSGTVADFLESQGVRTYLELADAYGAVLARMLEALARREGYVEAQGEAVASLAEAPATGESNLLDMDATVTRYCAERGRDVPESVEDKARLHIAAIEAFISSLARSV